MLSIPVTASTTTAVNDKPLYSYWGNYDDDNDDNDVGNKKHYRLWCYGKIIIGGVVWCDCGLAQSWLFSQLLHIPKRFDLPTQQFANDYWHIIIIIFYLLIIDTS